MIEVANLVKRYESTEAVSGVDFTVEEGEVFALLGPNGAGKTTTVEILEGHRQRTSGSVLVLGTDPSSAGRQFRERIGIVLQTTALEKELTVSEAVETFAAVYARSLPPPEVINLVGLEEKAGERIKTLSGGQQRRLELALGIVGDPDLLFLDEPTTGFDPSARRKAWELVEDLKGLGKTILLTTHYMDEAQHLADRVAVISAGKIVATGTPETLGAGGTAAVLVSFKLPVGSDRDDLPGLGLEVAGDRVTANPAAPTEFLHDLTEWAISRGIELEDLRVERPTLEDVYLELTANG